MIFYFIIDSEHESEEILDYFDEEIDNNTEETLEEESEEDIIEELEEDIVEELEIETREDEKVNMDISRDENNIDNQYGLTKYMVLF